jgi:hypothetical protein
MRSRHARPSPHWLVGQVPESTRTRQKKTTSTEGIGALKSNTPGAHELFRMVREAAPPRKPAPAEWVSRPFPPDRSADRRSDPPTRADHG